MIVTRTRNNHTALPAWDATTHAAELSAKYEPTYSLVDKFKGELVERLATVTFHQSDVYKNYRKKFIAVKVCAPTAEELISDNCRKMFDLCHANDIEVVHTRTGVIFRVRPE